MNNSKIFLTLGCFCVLIFTSLNCVYQDHKKKRKAEYQKIVSEAHQHMRSLHTWKGNNHSNPELTQDNESVFNQ